MVSSVPEWREQDKIEWHSFETLLHMRECYETLMVDISIMYGLPNNKTKLMLK